MSARSSLSRAEARRWLVGHLGLATVAPETGAAGVRALLERLRCIQLDPLDPMGTNADLVALARVDGIGRGDVYRHLLPGYAFEHFAKERCLLPPSAFPYYRARVGQRGRHWWGPAERLRRLPPKVVEAVRAHVQAHGPVGAQDMPDHGTVRPLDWSGWKSTGRATSMALEVLWARCEVVVCGRRGRGKIYDVPARALPAVHDAASPGEFGRWALIERVEAAGLLSRLSGPQWSMIADVRTSKLPDQLVRAGVLEEVEIEGDARRYLAPAGFRDRPLPAPDGRVRVLAPLDPLLWDRKLVAHAFGFDYIWEVYKPPATRRWGWYVHPLLHGERLVGRLEGRVRDGALWIDNVWREAGVKWPTRALAAALRRHAQACGVRKVAHARASEYQREHGKRLSARARDV